MRASFNGMNYSRYTRSSNYSYTCCHMVTIEESEEIQEEILISTKDSIGAH